MKCPSCGKLYSETQENYGGSVNDLPLPIPFCLTPAWRCPECGYLVDMDSKNSSTIDRESCRMKIIETYYVRKN